MVHSMETRREKHKFSQVFTTELYSIHIVMYSHLFHILILCEANAHVERTCANAHVERTMCDHVA